MTGHESLQRISGLIESVEKKSRPFREKCAQTKILAFTNPEEARTKYLHLARETFPVSGTSLVGLSDASYSIGVGNLEYDTDSDVAGASVLTGTPMIFASSIAMSTDQDVFFWISIPTGLPSQGYQGNVTITGAQS